MRATKVSRNFKRDYRREQSGVLGKKLDALLLEVTGLLATDSPLPSRYIDHALVGEWTAHRDCHIRPRSPPPLFLRRRESRQSAAGFARTCGIVSVRRSPVTALDRRSFSSGTRRLYHAASERPAEARGSMKSSLAFLIILSCCVGVSPLVHAASPDGAPSYGPQLEGFDYPWSV